MRARDGHLPTLIACFAHFDVCFMLWVLIGALGAFIFDGTHVDAAMKGLVVGVPILTGSLLRVPLGMLGDRIGGRRIGLALLVFLIVPLTLAWQGPGSLGMLIAIGLMLGTAGASFAVVLPLASRWYSAERQGLVMGIAAAGNSGTVITNLVAPRLAAHVGWQGVFGLAMLPLAAVLAAFMIFAREAPARLRSPRSVRDVLRESDLWWFCLFYSVTFGGYVGLSSFLPLFLRDQHGLAAPSAGLLTAAAAFVGSGARPIGGWLADRLGGRRLLAVSLSTLGLTYALVASGPALQPLTALVLVAMACCGLGNGAVFQLVPIRFRAEIGMVTGIIGAVGGIGGFLLPMLLGMVRQAGGGFGAGFLLLAAAAMSVALVLQVLAVRQAGWRGSWQSTVAQADGV